MDIIYVVALVVAGACGFISCKSNLMRVALVLTELIFYCNCNLCRKPLSICFNANLNTLEINVAFSRLSV